LCAVRHASQLKTNWHLLLSSQVGQCFVADISYFAAERSKRDLVASWWEALIPILDHMPDDDWAQIDAPTKTAVYGMYMEDAISPGSGLPLVSESYFNEIWREDYGHQVRLRKYHRFSKCEECLRLKNERAKYKHGSAYRSIAQAELHKHWALIRRYRQR
jgi:hypothetical protein